MPLETVTSTRPRLAVSLDLWFRVICGGLWVRYQFRSARWSCYEGECQLDFVQPESTVLSHRVPFFHRPL